MKITRYNFFVQIFYKKAAIALCSFFILNTSLLFAQEVAIYSGCNMVLNGNVNVVVNNTAFKNNGTFAAGSSTVSFTGNVDTTTGYISGSSYTRFNNLTVDKSAYGVAVKSSVGVKDVLTVTTGRLYADSNLTLLSDVSNTARLATVPSGADVLGKVMVERYIPAKRAWRLMTGPVTNGSGIYTSWQNNGVYTPGRGTLISAPGSSTGMDNANAASLKTWDGSGQAWVPVTNTYASISGNSGSADNMGYFVFIRGDRNLSNFIIPNTNVTTLTSIGNLQVGTQNFTASSTGGKYTLIGNPYASPLNFNSISRTNLVKRFYVWDPTINTLGGYVTLDDLDGDGVYSKSVAGSAQTKEIQSSQAFFVETISNGAASLSIAETAKSTTNNSYVFRPSAANESIRADLFLVKPDNSLVLADGILAEYNNLFNDGVTYEDALKFPNINENLGFVRNGITLAIERRPLLTGNDTLFLKISKTSQRSYQLKLTPENIDQPGLTAFFEDSYLTNSRPLSLTDTTVINFSIDGNPSSAATDRFRIVFKQPSVLPVTFRSVEAHEAGNKVEVRWKMENDINTLQYEVERSINGTDFTKVNSTGKNASGNYYWTDADIAAGKIYYRIKNIGVDGSVSYSAVVSVTIVKAESHFTIETNPVKGNSIRLHFSNQPAGNYQFRLLNSSGQLIYHSKVAINNSSTSVELNTRTALAAGVYQLQITGPSNVTDTQKIIAVQ